LTATCPGLLKVGGRDLDCYDLRLMPKISCAGCLGLSLAISAQVILTMCVAAQNHEKSSKTPNFRGFKVVQSHRC